MPSVKSTQPLLSQQEYLERIAPFSHKINWFREQGYNPHFWQAAFHTMTTNDKLTRYRHLVAGRRGGKTLSAIWEVLYYCTFPEMYWRDFHGIIDKHDSLWIWVLAKDYKIGNPSWLGFTQALKESGMQYGVEYRQNKTNKFFEFSNDTLVEFKTADDPQSLRGAGLNLMWIDEAAMIPDDEAWNVVSPALADKLGGLITTTTPDGKNWFYDEWFAPNKLSDESIGRVEYTTLDNKYFPRESWDKEKARMHPMLFKQEYLASFDSMAGKDLSGDWLHYYNKKDIEGKEFYTYVGVDPAISLSDKADYFSMTLIGLEKVTNDVYLLEQFNARVPFPEQVQMIQEWHLKYRPQLIGIENTAYQAALAQQTARLSTIPPIAPITAKGKKAERILSMSPLFKIGKVKIRKDHEIFIDQWVGYDSAIKNPKDDALDSMEIALRTAGALLPELYTYDDDSEPVGIQAIVDSRVPSAKQKGYDSDMGSDW